MAVFFFLKKSIFFLKNLFFSSLFSRETPELNFANLPDPFGSYAFRIPSSEISVVTISAGPVSAANAAAEANAEKEASDGVKPSEQKADEGLDHIEDPAMQSLVQREITR